MKYKTKLVDISALPYTNNHMPGPAPKFKQASRVLSVRVPAKDYEEIKALFNDILKKYLP